MNAEVTTTAADILIVEDDREVSQMLCEALERANYRCTTAFTTEEVETLIRQKEFAVIVSDISLPGGLESEFWGQSQEREGGSESGESGEEPGPEGERKGLDLLQLVNRLRPQTKVILITGHRRTEWAKEAMRNGAYEYMEKPFDLSAFHETVTQALHERQMEKQTFDRGLLSENSCLLLLDAEGTIRYMSGAFGLVTGLNPQGSLGVSFDEVIRPTGSSFAELVEQAGVSQKVTVPLHRGRPVEYQAEIEVQPVYLSDRHVYLVRMSNLLPKADEDRGREESRSIEGGTVRDSLTGLPNHRDFQEELSRIRSRCQRYGRSLSLLLLNVRGFRRINELYGFRVGDEVLAELGQLLRKKVRMADYVGRFSSEDFAVLMPETDGLGAELMAARLSGAIDETRFAVRSNKLHILVVMGIVEGPSSFIGSQTELIQRAQEAMERARRSSGSSSNYVLWRPTLTFPIHQSDEEDGAERRGAGAQGEGATIDRRLREVYLDMTRSLVAAVEAKDPYTKHHSLNVADYAEQFARGLGLAEERIRILRCAATLHDVGKIGIPDAILTKPGRLTAEEFEMIKQHPVIGAGILGQSSFLSAEVGLVRHHHEWYDGRGYPDGLKGSEVPEETRILQVADAFDAMICTRSYKKGYHLDKIVSELAENSGRQFDPEVARVAMEFVQNTPEKIHLPE